MSVELIKLVTAVAPSVRDTITKLLTYKNKPNVTDITIVLLATVIEQNNVNAKAINEMCTSLRNLHAELIRKGTI